MSELTNQLNQTTAPADQMTVIGPDTQIKGEMFFEKSARILGRFEGKIMAQGEVQIGSGADCHAAVEAERVVVDGDVHGPITARDRLTLTANAKVQGDLQAGTLVVAEGASFVGHCNVGPKAAEMTKAEQRSRTQASAQIESKPGLVGAETDFTPPWRKDQVDQTAA